MSRVYPPRAVRFFKEFHSEAKILERHRQGAILVVEQEGTIIATLHPTLPTRPLRSGALYPPPSV